MTKKIEQQKALKNEAKIEFETAKNQAEKLLRGSKLLREVEIAIQGFYFIATPHSDTWTLKEL